MVQSALLYYHKVALKNVKRANYVQIDKNEKHKYLNISAKEKTYCILLEYVHKSC